MFLYASNIITTRNRVFNMLAGLSKASAALADVITTCSLCYGLGYIRTGIRATDSVLKTLIGFAIQRGLLVAVVQIALLIVFYASSPHLYWLGLHVNVTRVYANTFFAMLHAREGLKKELEMKSIVTSVLEIGNSNQANEPFSSSTKAADEETDTIKFARGIWMGPIKGSKTVDTPGIARIQVDQRVIVSDI